MNNPELSSIAAAVSAGHGSEMRYSGLPILVVDDEPCVRKLTMRLLERAGYAAVEAEDGEHALAMLQARNGEVALVLSDIQMPGMGGLELARAVARGFPGVRTVLMSAYADQFLPLGKSRFFVSKPFTQEALLNTIHCALEWQAK